jgi:hypothetical protein
LSNHDLDTRTYRTKYGIPAAQPLSARAPVAKRRQIATEVKPWEKPLAYVKGQAVAAMSQSTLP